MPKNIKIIVAGAGKVGKSNLVKRLVGKEFSDEYSATIGVDKVIRHEELIQYQIWDTAGVERYGSISRGYMKNSEVMLLCFDPHEKSSFIYLQTKIEGLKEESGEQTKLILVATKSDIAEHLTEVTEEEIQEFQRSAGIDGYVKTSARNGDQIEELFDLIKKSCPDLVTFDVQESQVRDSEGSRKELEFYSSSFLFTVFGALAAVGGSALIIAAIIITSSFALAAGGACFLAIGGFFAYKATETYEPYKEQLSSLAFS